jgi:hypothetical protein
MSLDAVFHFLAAVQSDVALRSSLRCEQPTGSEVSQTVVEIAKAAGFVFTAEELRQAIGAEMVRQFQNCGLPAPPVWLPYLIGVQGFPMVPLVNVYDAPPASAATLVPPGEFSRSEGAP